jgi:hypothetical protein
VRIDLVGLPGVAGVKHPHSGGQLRGHVDHGLAVCQQPLGQRASDALSAFHRPPMVWPLAADVPAHPLIVPIAGAESAFGQDPFLLVDDLQGHRTLVGVDPHDHASHPPRLLLSLVWFRLARKGIATLSQGNPLLSHNLATVSSESAVRK